MQLSVNNDLDNVKYVKDKSPFKDPLTSGCGWVGEVKRLLSGC